MEEVLGDLTETLITHTTDIVVSYVSNNSITADEVPALIQNVYATLSGLGGEGGAAEVKPEPAVSIRASVKRDHIVCLEDGKKMKMLKRHLMTDHGLTPDEYRARWGLPADYPMVAPRLCRQAPRPGQEDRPRPQAGSASRGRRKKAVA